MSYREYRNKMFGLEYTAHQVMEKIDMPKSIYKYRCFYRDENGQEKEDPFWKGAMEGEVFFSLAKDFNRNDPHDCEVYYRETEIRKQIYYRFGYEGPDTEELRNKFNELMENYKKNVRDNFRIGCFTNCSIEKNYMWEQKDFGGEHKGFCIEYEYVKEKICPKTIVFLPVLYERKKYDMTNIFLDMLEYDADFDNPKLQKRIVPICYNFALVKDKSYFNEKEWRVLITNIRYSKYFTKEAIRDYSDVMKAIYLGCDYKKVDENGEKYKFALKVCREKKIPLYEMHRIDGKNELEKVCVYNPE